MTNDKEHTCIDDPKIISDIEKYGLSVIVIEATDYLPSFAYSVGLWRKYKHPEIISFGLTVETLHAAINNAADLVKDGQIIESGKNYGDIFTNIKTEFINVDKRNLRDYFGYAIDLYKTIEFPALQLVWTDRKGKFPWESDFEEEFTYKQPLLDRNAGFKFREPKNLATFTTRQWIELKKPIIHVVHDDNGDWQFLTGDQFSEDVKIVALEQLILGDETLNEVFDLDYGEEATRDLIGGRWTRRNVEYESED
ncbi:MAG: DUF4262 domain-containing protein [Chryseotalea sp. WA131a]|jgi:hypothetical protein|nr:MAG: DUF4262 domain-containing protein [Chryseotalea sp. WA131a]